MGTGSNHKNWLNSWHDMTYMLLSLINIRSIKEINNNKKMYFIYVEKILISCLQILANRLSVDVLQWLDFFYDVLNGRQSFWMSEMFISSF